MNDRAIIAKASGGAVATAGGFRGIEADSNGKIAPFVRVGI
jgi:hypothetical protein